RRIEDPAAKPRPADSTVAAESPESAAAESAEPAVAAAPAEPESAASAEPAESAVGLVVGDVDGDPGHRAGCPAAQPVLAAPAPAPTPRAPPPPTAPGVAKSAVSAGPEGCALAALCARRCAAGVTIAAAAAVGKVQCERAGLRRI